MAQPPAKRHRPGGSDSTTQERRLEAAQPRAQRALVIAPAQDGQLAWASRPLSAEEAERFTENVRRSRLVNVTWRRWAEQERLNCAVSPAGLGWSLAEDEMEANGFFMDAMARTDAQIEAFSWTDGSPWEYQEYYFYSEDEEEEGRGRGQSLAAVAALDAQLQPATQKLKREREDMEKLQANECAEIDCEAAELERKYKEQQAQLRRKRAALERRHVTAASEMRCKEQQLAPLRAERDRRGGYLQLVAVDPSLQPAVLAPGAPHAPTTLQAAQQRLAAAGIASGRLGAASILSSDIAEMVANHLRGFDHFEEAAKVEEHGEEAARARLQFRPRTLPAPGAKPQATGFLLEGCSAYNYDGVYRLVSEDGNDVGGWYSREHEGWPVFKSDKDIYCFRYKPEDSWRFSHQFDPDTGKCCATIVAKEGPLPVGVRTWHCAAGNDGWENGTLTTTLLSTEAEVLAAERRTKAAWEAAQAANAVLATEQVEQASLSIEGHPNSHYDGVYTLDSSHKGWPVLKNARGMFCYRHRPTGSWRLFHRFHHEYIGPSPGPGRHFTEHVANNAAHIHALDGLLPVGAHIWQCWVDNTWEPVHRSAQPEMLGRNGGSQVWEKHTLTICLE